MTKRADKVVDANSIFELHIANIDRQEPPFASCKIYILHDINAFISDVHIGVEVLGRYATDAIFTH